MAVVSMSYLLEAGVHFGHQTKRWNPKMKEYIYNSRDDIYIIDLQKTVEKMEEAYAALTKIVQDGGNVLYEDSFYERKVTGFRNFIYSGSFYRCYWNCKWNELYRWFRRIG